MHQRQTHRRASRLTAAAALVLRMMTAALLLLTSPTRAWAHEIPQHVAIRAFVQRDGATLRLLVRVPLEAMRDIDFPLRNDGSLDLVRVRPLLPDAAQLWIATNVRVTANGTPLAAPRVTGARLALPNDRSFATFATARASFAADPLASQIIDWRQPLFDVSLEYALPDPGATLVLHPDLARLGIRTTSVLHLVDATGAERVLTYTGSPDAVALNPAWYSTAVQFFRDGFGHILGGLDHLLFVCCLVLPLRRWRDLVTVITAFTVAHSLTLGAAALGAVPAELWFPPLVETLIAASIVWLAIENVLLPTDRLAARWPVAFGFGLIHGFGFSFALAEQLQFAGGNLLSALAAFNVGVEVGQLAVLAAAVPVLWLLRRYVGATREAVITVVGSAVVGHQAWHWLTERGAELAEHRGALAWPTLDASFAVVAMRVALLAAVALAVALAMRQILRVSGRCGALDVVNRADSSSSSLRP